MFMVTRCSLHLGLVFKWRMGAILITIDDNDEGEWFGWLTWMGHRVGLFAMVGVQLLGNWSLEQLV